MRVMILACSAVLSATSLARAADAPLNPQPLPPGRHAQNARPAMEPCPNGNHMMMNKDSTGQMAAGGHMAADCASRPNNQGVHKLNPQPLPPG
jgi:hypothetical protein